MSDMSNLLVLEDDEGLREILTETLEDTGLSAYGVGSAAEAVIACEKFSFDIVLSDIRMAGELDGLGALELIKARLPELSCIVMTGFANDDSPMRALRIQVDDYIYKPFQVKDLVSVVQTVRQAHRKRHTYEEALASFFHRKLEAAFEALNKARSACFTFLRVAIRSRYFGAERPEPVITCWDALEDIEMGYLRFMNNRGQVSPEAVQSGVARYTNFLHFVKMYLGKGSLPAPKPRTPDKVTRDAMKTLIARIYEGIVTTEDLHLAVLVRRMAPAQRASNPYFVELHSKMWGTI